MEYHINTKNNEVTKKFKEEITKIKSDLPKLRADLESKMAKYGSIELMANIAIQELIFQSPEYYDVTNPISENPFLVFFLGLFLKHNNLKHGEPTPNQVQEIITSIEKYFDAFKWDMLPMDPKNHQNTDSLIAHSRLKKIHDDGNPHCYPDQKYELIKNVFSSLDHYLMTKHGFTIADALEYQEKIEKRIEHMLIEKSKSVRQIIEKTSINMNESKTSELENKLKQNGQTMDHFINYFAWSNFFYGSKNILVINTKTFCEEENIKSIQKFESFMKTFSCTFGEQFEEFNDPLSLNIIFYKPIIRLNTNTFFIPKPDFLKYRLDTMLEYLLKDEKEKKRKIWQKFNNEKSRYLEKKTFECFSKIFPQNCLHKNMFYKFKNKQFETDLLIVYDTKIFVIESKSNRMPLSAKRGGMKSLEHTMKQIVDKANQQAANVSEYIRTNEISEFKNDKEQVILTINSKQTAYEFFFINVTLDNLGDIGTNLKELNPLQLFTKTICLWSTNLYDLDIISQFLSEPSYFIHYLEQRIRTQNENIFHVGGEIDFLGYYYKTGNFYQILLGYDTKVNRIMLTSDYCDEFDRYYLQNGKKPNLIVPPKLDELIKNMQKYKQKGFTKITSLLLDFPQKERELIAKSIRQKIKATVRNGTPNGFTITLKDPFDIGFSYYTSTSMKGFYKYSLCRSKYLKKQQKITHWAMIGRNVTDKKNFATFFHMVNE